MKNMILTLITVFALFLSSCTSNKTESAESTTKEAPVTMVCAIDASNRIETLEVRQRDISTILQVFNDFEKRVKKHHYVKSRDRFMVQLIRQTTNTSEMKEICDGIHLDLSVLKSRQKRKATDQFKEELPSKLAQLYEAASKQNTYSGADIYEYYEQKIPAIMDMSSTDKVMIVMLTDGYIEIDPAEEVGQRNGRYNTLNSKQMSALRRNDTYLKDCDVMLIPDKLSTRNDLDRLKICVVGLQPRGGYINEGDLLDTIWQTFLNKMQIKNQVIGYHQPSNVSAQLLSNVLLNY